MWRAIVFASMNTFQTQYPLSSKKFLKKMLGSIIPALLMSVILGFGIAYLLNINAVYFSTIITQGISISIVFLLIILGLYSWYFKAYIQTYFYEGSENFITIKKRVFTPREIHVQYAKIQDVYVDQDLIDRILGLYDVHIASATAASGLEAHIDGVEVGVAEGLKNFFLDKIQHPGTSQAVPSEAATSTTSAPASLDQSQSTVQFSEDISDKTFPIQKGWMTKRILGIAGSSIFVSLFFTLYASSWFFNVSSREPLIIPTYFVILVIVFIFHYVALVIWKSNYRFQFTPEYIQFHTGIISQSEKHLPYRSIQDVSTSQSILDRIFKLTNVTIENAAQQVQTRANRRNNNNIVLVGQTEQSAAKIIDALKPVMLSRNSSQTGL
jgi:uncharacterized membrane protein YdbT with pleckstrin-like domain